MFIKEIRVSEGREWISCNLCEGFTEDQINEMLDIHNALRAQVASGSANGLPSAGKIETYISS